MDTWRKASSIPGNTPSALLLQYCASLLYHWQHTFCITASALHFFLSIRITGNTAFTLTDSVLAFSLPSFYLTQNSFCITGSVLCFFLLSFCLMQNSFCLLISIALLFSVFLSDAKQLLLTDSVLHFFLLSFYQHHWQHSFYTNRFCVVFFSCFSLSESLAT